MVTVFLSILFNGGLCQPEDVTFDLTGVIDHPLHFPDLPNLWLIGAVVASPHMHSEVPDTKCHSFNNTNTCSIIVTAFL